MSHLDIPSFLRHQPLFQQLSPEQIQALVPHTQELRGLKGQVIFQKGDPCDGMFLVVYGRVKLALSSAQGSEKVMEIIHPGQSFAEAVMFLGRPCPVMAQFLEDGMLLKVEAAGILQAIDHDPAFARRLLAGLSLRLHGLVRDVERYSIESSLQRVIGYLLQHIPEDGGSLTPQVSLPVNKSLIASRLNLTPETFSRMLHQLIEAELIKVDGRDITLVDVDKLKAFGSCA
ncbi:Crp/Fnr family transcriptional regulator [Chromobacterium haemolyticum]|uniref:Crp/Fnr family transcriptional regulator n=1 Tax=Chromobacterium fluminis TaxID=3044269 RepID=A0ABX0LAU3_9NEIS|nr:MULTISPECIES: Crp/Fnr family transcriptional regulator [Chromobacterium]NHR08719.1 Crp/Fnr family transcriptional regulator [Chromobacterium haemolyticum]